jgi:hypothetical protein
MQFEYLLSGGAPTIKKYKMAAGHAAGIVVLVAAAGATGLSTSTTTSFADAVGVTLDAILSASQPVAYSTTQNAVEYLQSVVISPDAVFRSLMVGSAANGAVEERTVGTASSNGLTVVGTTGDTDPSNPDMDEGTVWYVSGSNGGASRKITSTTTTLTVTVVMPFAANAVGNKYITNPYTPGAKSVTMSTDLKNVRVDLAKTGADARIVDQELNGKGDSYLHLFLSDHIFSSNT